LLLQFAMGGVKRLLSSHQMGGRRRKGPKDCSLKSAGKKWGGLPFGDGEGKFLGGRSGVNHVSGKKGRKEGFPSLDIVERKNNACAGKKKKREKKFSVEEEGNSCRRKKKREKRVSGSSLSERREKEGREKSRPAPVLAGKKKNEKRSSGGNRRKG